MDFKGKNLIYVGGFGGIGQKCVEELLKKQPKNLIIFDLTCDTEFLKYLQKNYISTTVDYIPIDLTKRESIERAFERAMTKLGQLDVVFNGSGILNERLIDLTIAINLTGLIHSCLIALHYMSKAKGGKGGAIVNISSTSGLDPSGATCVYSATKFAVNGFTRSFAHPIHFRNTGVSFITICPGITLTPLAEDLPPKLTMTEYAEQFMHLPAKLGTQTTQECAKSFIEIMAKAQNGSVWLLNVGQYEQIECPYLFAARFES